MQRTPEWYAERLGKATASRIADVMATTRSGYGASRANYMAELICERLTGQPAIGYINADMQWGIEQEEYARAAYEFMENTDVAPVGFIDHPSIPDSGASPDGLVMEDGLVEFKCPKTATHLDFLLTGVIPDKYLKQMQWQMACAERQWCDFASFDPRLPAELRMKIVRVERDDKEIERMEGEVRKFLQELGGKMKALEAMRSI